MNLKCLICSDLFTPYADIYTTPCGHLFHHPCLIQWIERSRTCPQCRNKSTEKSIHKIYLSVEENAETTDYSTLQNKFDNLQFQFNLKDKDLKTANEKCKVAKAQNTGLRDEIKSQENKLRVLESAIHAVKEQVIYFKSKVKDGEKLEDEIVRLKTKLRDMECVEMIISRNQEQIDDMLRHNRDPHSLTILVTTLRKELIDVDKKTKEVQRKLKEVQNESLKYKLEVTRLTKTNSKLQQEVESHKLCETERQYLKKNIKELNHILDSKSQVDSSGPANTSIRRIITESPAPLDKQLLNHDISGSTSSPSVPEKVKAIKDSDSPYLLVQSSSVGFSGLVNYNTKYQLKPSSSKSLNKFSIFKQPSQTLESIKRPSLSISYDGLGGHSKDEKFPASQATKMGAKRPKSTSTLTSAKFRKLAPGPQKKLNEFFRDSQDD